LSKLVTVMAVASIIALRIINDWKPKYANLPVNSGLGQTCAREQPMYCRQADLSRNFDSQDARYDAQALLNSSSDKANDSNWNFDPKTLVVSNDTHWKGIFPRDTDIQNTLRLYFGGFWKRFTKDPVSGEIVGITHPYEFPISAPNKATSRDIDGFGNVILLEYTQPPYNLFYDVLKIVNDHTVLGKAYFGKPAPGREILVFSMSRKYPFEFMTQEDHEMLYNKVKKPSLDAMVGIWVGQLVSDSTWTDPVFRFRYYFEKGKNILKNDYLFGIVLAGTAVVSEKTDHLEMYDATGVFHDEIRQVNENVMIRKYYSKPDYLFNWLPDRLEFLHIDKTRPSIYLPYVLKRVGNQSAFRNKIG
jgi:hypothetical protein